MTTADRNPSDPVHHSYQLWSELWIIDAAADYSMMLCNFKSSCIKDEQIKHHLNFTWHRHSSTSSERRSTKYELGKIKDEMWCDVRFTVVTVVFLIWFIFSLCKLVIRQQLLQVSREQLLLHGEANPSSGLAHVGLDLTDVLNMSGNKMTRSEVWRAEELIQSSHFKSIIMVWK